MLRRLMNRKSRSRPAKTQGATYEGLESRRLLVVGPLPDMTTDVSEYADTAKDAVVRVDDQKRLVVRTTGEENRIRIHLGHNYLQVNRINNAFALQLDSEQYTSIILISGGDDVVRVYGSDLNAQLHPNRLWVSTNSISAAQDAVRGFEVNGTGFEHLEIHEAHFFEFGPFIHGSNNRIRMYGTDGVDHLTMGSDNAFAISTSAAMSGDGYYFRANAFGDLYVNARGGDDMASLAGTRGFADGSLPFAASAYGEDFYFAQDNYSRITNTLWEGRFFNFETQRVDLLSGSDQAVVFDASRDSTFYRFDGSQLVGAWRRLIGVEEIRIEGSETSNDLLRVPEFRNGELQEYQQRIRVKFSIDTNPEDDELPVVGGGLQELVPQVFIWTFTSFERIRG